MENSALNIVTLIRQTVIGGGVPTDDERIRPGYILGLVNKYRVEAIEREWRERRFTDPQVFQKINGLLLEEVDRAEHCVIQAGCKTKRVAIPKIMPMRNNAMVRVYTGSRESEIPVIDKSMLALEMARRIRLNPFIAVIDGGYLYIHSPAGSVMKYVAVDAVLEDPMEIQGFQKDCGTECFDWDSPYPISQTMREYIDASIYGTEFRISRATTVQDNVENGRDDRR